MKVLIGYDGSAHSQEAIADIVNTGIEPNSTITLIGVAESSAMVAASVGQNVGMGEIGYTTEMLAQIIQEEISRMNAQLAEAVATIKALMPSAVVNSETVLGRPAAEILERLRGGGYDLVILGSHGRGALSRLFLGSVSLQILHAAPCSVRIVKESGRKHDPLRILLTVDGSPHSDRMLDRVARYHWGKPPRATLIYVDDLALIATIHGFGVEMVSKDTGMLGQAVLDSAKQRLGELGRDARTVCKIGNPVGAIVDEAIHEGTHTIYLGAQGHRTFDRLFLGSVSHGVASKFNGCIEVIR